jgi:predicted naringenin-chalcone synthase
MPAYLNRIGTAVPPHDVHAAFVHFVQQRLETDRDRRLFDRMARRAAIAHRYSFIDPAQDMGPAGGAPFYIPGAFPGTARRMAHYERHAPPLAEESITRLSLGTDVGRITHLVVASCTGFMAPGLDQLIVRRLGLRPTVERTVVGYMGCYAGVTALRLAHHLVRSDPAARVLVVALELCSLHFQDTANVEEVLSMLLFADGCAAALVTGDATGLELRDFRSAAITEAAHAITWRIGDAGFLMHLSGEVPGYIRAAMQQERERQDPTGLLYGEPPADIPLWAVHAGGRSILDAVESGFALPADALARSRAVLHDYGNMSSATILFILQRLLAEAPAHPRGTPGFGVAFGPGLAAESFRFAVA